MRTAGIDLATEPERTAACTVDGTGETTTVRLVRNCTDTALVDVCRSSDKTGIDCPFGWPQPFVDALQEHAQGLAWPGRHQPPGAFRAQLRGAETDREVRLRTDCIPLSVAADRIGLTAMRCALLLDDLGDVDRTGITGTVAEVYPAASLNAWGLPWKGYKGAAGRTRLPALFAEVSQAIPTLSIDETTRIELETSDDAFDALICALTARAILGGRPHHPGPAQMRLAAREGWVHVPVEHEISSCVSAH